jgi:hypothetical protein
MQKNLPLKMGALWGFCYFGILWECFGIALEYVLWDTLGMLHNY